MRALVACAVAVFAAALPSTAWAASQTFTATADSYVSSAAPDTNYGSGTRLWVETGPPLMRTYLRFDVELPAGATITGATLRLYTGAGSTSIGYQAYSVSDTSWGESTLTYNNAPVFGTKLGSSGGWSSGDVYIPVTLPSGYIHTGLNSIGVATSATSSKDFYSRTAGSNPPVLLVSYTPAPTTTTSTTGTTSTTSTTSTGSSSTTSTTPPPTSTTYPLRGVYDRDLSSTGFSDEAAAGFSLIDSGPDTVDSLTGGLQGMVWVGNYDNSTCSWQVSDSTLTSYVSTHKGDPKVGVWFIADEPDPHACPTAPAQVKARTALIHNIDPSAKTLLVIDGNSGKQSLNQLAGWVGTADAYGLDPYTCYQGQTSCNLTWIDTLAAQADSVGLTPYWAVVQAFGDPTGSGDWFESLDSSGNSVWGQARLPTADELHQEFVHWRATHMQDYLAFAWRWPASDSSLWLANQPALISQLRTENSISAGASSTSTSSGSTTSTSTTPTTTTTTTTTPPPDTTPPSAPTGLTVTGTTGTSESLSWSPSSDNVGVSGYGVYLNNARVGSTTSTSYTFNGLTCSTTYQLGVDAYDAAGNRSSQTTMLAKTSACLSPPPAGVPHVMVIAEENRSYSQIVGNTSLPYINSLINQYGSATDWWGLSHPSEPNYLGMVSGSIWDNPPDDTPQQETYAGPTVVDQMANAGIGWKAYMEDMRQPCDLTDTYSPGNYDVNHNPFMYFNTIRTNSAQCNRDVPFTQFATDLSSNTAPPFMFVSPNLLHDMHDGTYADADSWLQNTMNEVLASQWYAQGGVVIITWDEGGSAGDQIPTIVVSQDNAGKRLSSFGNHYGMLRAIEEAYGLPLLGHAADTTVGDLTPLF